MQIFISRDEKNFNLIKDSDWKYFSKNLAKIFQEVLNEKIYDGIIKVDRDGKNVEILLDVKERESLQIVKLKFEEFVCKEIVYDNDGKKKEYQTKNLELLWHKFLVESLGDGVLHDLYDFYKKNNRDFEKLKDFARRTEGL